MAGSLPRPLYNVADTQIVGRVLGEEALAAVGLICMRKRRA